MATYVNDLRLKEITTGDESGTWGTSTNTNLELIAEAFSYGTEVITTNADTHTTTIADGSTDPGRSLYLKYTGTLDSACTITIGPDTVSKVWIIENGTSGSQDIILSQGSGANITIPAGDTKVVYSDGAGAGAAFFDAFASLSVVDLKVQDDLTVTDDASVGGDATITGTLGVTGVFTGTSLDISGDIDVDGTTNLDVVDIDGAVDMASTALVTGVLTANGGAVFNETGADVDFRVESDTVDHALFVQGSDGNVGIGTSSPSTPLDVTGVIKSASATQSSLYLSNAAKTTGFLVGRSLSSNDAQDFFIYDATAAATRLAINSSGNVSTSGAVLAGASVNNFAPNKLVTGEGTDGEAGLNIQTSATGTGYVLFGDGAGAAAYRGQIRYSQTDDSMNFHTVTTTRLSIDSSGFLNIASAPKTGRINMQPNPANNHFFEFYNTADVKCGEINTADGTQTNYVTSSDYRLKEDDQPMTGATERVKALRPINFAWKVNGSRVDGFLAHEAQEVVPECVTGSKDAMRDEEYEVTPAVKEVRDEDGNVTTEAVAAVMGTRSVPDYQGIDQSKLVPLLTAALQEAITKIEDLTTRLETLENA
jgi:hypothetical protein